MPWKFVGKDDGAGYPGMPWGDLSDEEMADAVKEIEPQFIATHGKIADCGLWKPAGKGKADPSPASPEPAGEGDK